MPTSSSAADSAAVAADQNLDPLVCLPKTDVYNVSDGIKSKLMDGNVRIMEYPAGSFFLFIDHGFQYPLLPDLPVLRISQRYYIVPQELGSDIFIGLSVHKDVPAEVVDEWERLLAEHTAFRINERDEAANKSYVARGGHGLASGIEKGGSMVSAGLLWGAAKVGQGIAASGRFVERNTAQREPTKLSDSTKKKVATAKVASGSAVKVSQGVLQGVAAMTSKMANEIADTVSKSKYAQSVASKSGAGGPKTQAAKHVGAAGIGALLEVYEAMEEAGYVLLRETGSAVSGVVTHRYGEEAGEAAADGFKVAEDGVTAYRNARKIGTRTIAKGIGVKTSQQLLASEEEKKEIRSEQAKMNVDPMTVGMGMMVLDSVTKQDNLQGVPVIDRKAKEKAAAEAAAPVQNDGEAGSGGR